MHRIPQGEGGEQGDAMMPLLFAVGQRGALEVTHRDEPGELLLAFHDDVCMATPPARVGPMYAVVQEELYVHVAIRVQKGQGVEPGRSPSCRLQHIGADSPRHLACGQVP